VKRFAGKAALITGAASGIGRAAALRLAEEGSDLYLVDLAADALAESAQQCGERGAAVAHAVCDVADESQVQAAVADCAERFGRLDALCNIAGILLLEHAGNTTAQQFRRILEVNLLGTFLMCRAALPHLLESRGAIVNTSSTAALAGMPYAAAYGASKGGVSALTRTLAVEFAKQGLRCNAVCPGSIRTPMTGSGSLPENADLQLVSRAMPLDEARGPEAVAGLIALLASEDGRHINGEEVRVDGGTLA